MVCYRAYLKRETLSSTSWDESYGILSWLSGIDDLQLILSETLKSKDALVCILDRLVPRKGSFPTFDLFSLDALFDENLLFTTFLKLSNEII